MERKGRPECPSGLRFYRRYRSYWWSGKVPGAGQDLAFPDAGRLTSELVGPEPNDGATPKCTARPPSCICSGAGTEAVQLLVRSTSALPPLSLAPPLPSVKACALDAANSSAAASPATRTPSNWRIKKFLLRR
jgi:hypothetical protein